ncbi:MAG: hypothetical protein PHS57_05375 [Alphaproteobacteria bacterium]|nr:hypothetical protein [Alphaproteobacteria bacterium]
MARKPRTISLIVDTSQLEAVGAILGESFFAPLLNDGSKIGNTIIAGVYAPQKDLLAAFIKGAQNITSDTRLKRLDLGERTLSGGTMRFSSGNVISLPKNNLPTSVGIRHLNGKEDPPLGYIIENPSTPFIQTSTLSITATPMNDTPTSYFSQLKENLIEEAGKTLVGRRIFARTIANVINTKPSDTLKDDTKILIRIGLVKTDDKKTNDAFRDTVKRIRASRPTAHLG